jgi:hypothetical protein
MDDATRKALYDTVDELPDDALIKDLRKVFVQQRRGLDLDPAKLSVFETEGGEELRAGTELRDYFTSPSGSAAALPGPGKSEDTALIVTFPPPPQQQQNGELRCCSRILVFNVLFEYGNLLYSFIKPVCEFACSCPRI